MSWSWMIWQYIDAYWLIVAGNGFLIGSGTVGMRLS